MNYGSVSRNCFYVLCVVISSELLYHSYIWLSKKIRKRSYAKEVCEVIWTNECSQACGQKHGVFESKKKVFGAGRSKIKCPNPFCGTKNIDRIVEFINAAQFSIDLAMYTFTSFEISRAITEAVERGVLVRIVSDIEMAHSSGSQIIPLITAGIPVRYNRNGGIMHHKFCILDSPKRVDEIYKKHKIGDRSQTRCILLTGSLNWTTQGFGNNWENILITSNVKYGLLYSEEFERIWHEFDTDLNTKK